MILPDYAAYIKDHFDGSIEKVHRGDQTQHQWQFQAVNPSVSFPLGCKTCYKAYSLDKVVELVHKPKLQCATPVGQYTGLEAITVFCPWLPSSERISSDSDPSRLGVEGTYLLRSLPTAKTFTAAPFVDGGKSSIDKTLM